MKVFESAKQALKYIKRNSFNSDERTINDAICFGLGRAYVYTDIAVNAGLISETDSKDAFYHFKTESEIIRVLGYLLKNDGYLAKL